MDPIVKSRLLDLVAGDPALADQPDRLRQELLQTCAASRKEIAVITGMVQEGLVTRMKAESPTASRDLLFGRYVSEAQHLLGLAPDSAEWAVACWLDALPGKRPGVSVPGTGEPGASAHPGAPATTGPVLTSPSNPRSEDAVARNFESAAEPVEGPVRVVLAVVLGAVVFTIVAFLGIIGAAMGGMALQNSFGISFARTVLLVVVGGIGGYLGGMFGMGAASLVAERWVKKSGALFWIFSFCALAIGIALFVEKKLGWMGLVDGILVWLIMTAWAKKGMDS